MSIIATVTNDMIKLPPGVHLEDDTQVIILPQPKKRVSFADRYKDIIGAAGSGMNDLAENHDHYLYGTPKKTD